MPLRLSSLRRAILLPLLLLGIAVPVLGDSKTAKPAATADDPLRASLEGKTPQQKIEVLTPIVEGDKPTKEAWFHLGNARYELSDLPGATAAFEQAVAIDSTYFKAVMNLGLMYDEQQNQAKAIEVFEQAARLDPKNAEVWSYMGNAYYAQRDYAKAMDLYKKALQIKPDAASALYSMGVAFADASMFRDAVKYWKRVVEVDPNADIAKNARENIDLLQRYLIP